VPSHFPGFIACSRSRSGSLKLGDRIEIPEADITDWSYMRDGKYVGMITFKVRFKQMRAADVEQVKNMMVDP
jgi:uncharacterized protein YegJ (DUF2314 family)